METLPPGVRIVGPMPRGNGAFIAHRYLERHIPGYALVPFDPRITLLPPLLRLVLRRERPHLVHTVPDHAVFLSPPGVPLVITFQNYVLDEGMRESSGPAQYLHNRVLLRRFTRAALDRADAVIAVSRSTADLVRSDLGWDGPLHLIHNGIDTEQFRPSAAREHKDTLDVLFSGNLTRRKGFHLLPAIIRQVPENVHIWYTAGLRTRERRPQHPRLHSLGPVAPADMPGLYRRMDVLLAPTVREGLSLAVAEAMACGLPVVASNCSSLPEMVVEGEGGYLCAPGDPRAFAEALAAFALDADLCSRMGAFNRARAVSLFSHARMVAEYRELFGKVLGRGQA